jgi:hypothetical protein
VGPGIPVKELHPGIVDQHIYAAVLLYGCRHHILNVSRI